jgi:hypothetical protein
MAAQGMLGAVARWPASKSDCRAGRGGGRMAGKRKAALVRMKRVVEQAKATLVIAAPAERSRRDKAAVGKWVRDRVLIDWPSDSCLHCRKPIVAGQMWAVVSNGQVTARFHQGCHGEWLAQQETLARNALELDSVGTTKC